jgi:putative nucleotidyltransferase with HDIG domain
MEIQFQLPEAVEKIIKKVESFGFEIYIVGGAVRDILMKKKVADWDFATNAKPQDILNIFPKAFYNNKFGTVGLAQDAEVYEITTYRSEGVYRDFRHPQKITWGKTIEEDLKRRDFTTNAMALRFATRDQRLETRKKTGWQLATGSWRLSLIDPFGGQKDLEKKIIRAVGDPNQRFTEDALRLLRAIRIATELGFLIEPDTFLAIQKNASLIKKISGERIRDEIFKILATDHPADGFQILKNSHLLKETLPELEACFGVEQASPGRHHIYDVGTHLLKSLDNCPSKDPLVKFATLLHDIGKPKVQGQDIKGAITFYNHEVVGARMARDIANRLHLSRREREKLVTLVRWHQFTVDEATTPAAVRRFVLRVGVENIKEMIDLRIGDRLGGGLKEATSWRLRRFMKMIDEELHPPFKVTDLAISGHDVMRKLGIGPGPRVGEILNQLFEEVVEQKDKNTKEYLLKRLQEIKKQGNQQ